MTPGLRYVHQLVERRDQGDGRGARNVAIDTGCGLTGPPYGMGNLERTHGRVSRHAPEDEIRSTGWAQDVTCPVCRLRNRAKVDAIVAREAQPVP